MEYCAECNAYIITDVEKAEQEERLRRIEHIDSLHAERDAINEKICDALNELRETFPTELQEQFDKIYGLGPYRNQEFDPADL